MNLHLGRGFFLKSLWSAVAKVSLLILFPMLVICSAKAELRIDITKGQIEPTPIAISDLFGSGAEESVLGKRVSDIISRNLERSGLFRPIDQRAFIQRPESMLTRPRFADWRQINAQALVTGQIRLLSGNRLEVEFYLWDIFSEKYLSGLKLTTVSTQWRRIAHKVTDEIYKRLTGEQGYFDTRIVYIAETGPLDSRIKRLAVVDQDGENLRFLSDGEQLVLTPRFSPTAQEILYISYKKNGIPRVYLRKIDSGEEEALGKFPGMTFAPRFSPDGGGIILTYAVDGNSDIFEMDLSSHKVRRLTNNTAIDTSPSYSPDGKFIVFESDRGGSQQIYVMERNGTNVRRITFGKRARYGTPVWSPRGDLIAFTKSQNNKFSIGVIKPDGDGERILAQDFLVEGPTWAPNGRVLMFFRQTERNPDSAELVTIDVTGHHERILFTTTAASDPAWSPLIP